MRKMLLVQEDYEVLYNSALAQLDEKDATLRRLELNEAKLLEEGELLRKSLAEMTSSRAQLDSQLNAVQEGFHVSLQAITGGVTVVCHIAEILADTTDGIYL